MYEPPTTTEVQPAIPATGPRRRLPWLLVLLILLGVAAAGAYHYWRQQEQALAALRADRAEAEARLQHAHGRVDSELAALRSRIEAQDRAYMELKAEVAAGRNSGGAERERLQLALVEHLLLTASERLRLARDVAAARAALELADARLARLNDPRLLTLREMLAAERAALGRVPQVDTAGALLNLSALIDSAGALPLAASVPERFEPAAPVPAAAPAEPAGLWSRVEAGVREALGAMFSVRRARGPAPRLLTPQQEIVVQQVLLLRLEAVRVTLLRRAQPQLGEACAAAAQWLRLRYHPEDSGVQSALADLERIGSLPLDAPLPDLSGSLQRLRELLAADPG
jgi:uroporphyrin-III C-methyltransferase